MTFMRLPCLKESGKDVANILAFDTIPSEGVLG